MFELFEKIRENLSPSPTPTKAATTSNQIATANDSKEEGVVGWKCSGRYQEAEDQQMVGKAYLILWKSQTTALFFFFSSLLVASSSEGVVVEPIKKKRLFLEFSEGYSFLMRKGPKNS